MTRCRPTFALGLALALSLACRREADEPSPQPKGPPSLKQHQRPTSDPTIVLRGADRGWECGEMLIWRAHQGGAFWAAPRDDPRPDKARELGFSDAVSLACDGRHVYWLDTAAEAIQRRSLAPDGAIETIAQGDHYHASNIRTDGRRVYWLSADADAWQVRSASVQGGGEVLTHREHASLNPPVRLGERHVYWLRVETRGNWTVFVLERSPLTGGDREMVEALELPEAEHGTNTYDIVGGEIIYPSESTHQLFAVSEAEPAGPARLVHPHRDRFRGVRVHDGVAFYIASSHPGFTVKVLPLDSASEAREIGTFLGYQEEGFHVGERWLYWPSRSNLHREAWR